MNPLWLVQRIAMGLVLPVLWFGYLLVDTSLGLANFAQKAVQLDMTQTVQVAELKQSLREQKQAALSAKSQAETSRSSVRQTLMMDLSAYTCIDDHKRPGDVDYCRTADGTYLKEHHKRRVVAADPRVFRMGTRLMVEGVGEVTVRDKGGAIKGMRLDLYWDEKDRAGALKFGRQMRKVTMLE